MPALLTLQMSVVVQWEGLRDYERDRAIRVWANSCYLVGAGCDEKEIVSSMGEWVLPLTQY